MTTTSCTAPINNANQLEHVSGLVDRAPDHCRVLAGRTPAGLPGYFYEPTLVAGVHQGDELVTTEVFGPVSPRRGSATRTRRSRSPTASEYGLASSVWTRNVDTAARMSARLDFGCVWINCHIPLVAEMPHGGFKHSGYGKDLSMYGFEDYTRVKHVMHYHGFEG